MLDTLMEFEPLDELVNKAEVSRQTAMQCAAFLALLGELQSGNQATGGEHIEPTPTEYITYERSNQS